MSSSLAPKNVLAVEKRESPRLAVGGRRDGRWRGDVTLGSEEVYPGAMDGIGLQQQHQEDEEETDGSR